MSQKAVKLLCSRGQWQVFLQNTTLFESENFEPALDLAYLVAQHEATMLEVEVTGKIFKTSFSNLTLQKGI